MRLRKCLLLILTVGSLLLAGCQSDKVFNQAEGNVADAKEDVNTALQKSDDEAKPEPSMEVKEGLYVDKTPISISQRPAWLKKRIVLRGEELPFSYYSRTIVNGGYVLTRYQVGLDPSVKVSMNYSGTVQGALDALAARTGYVYSISGNNVYWQAYITRTFDIAFMPGSSDYMMGKAQSSAGSGGSTSTSTGGGANTVTATIDDSAASQYSNLKGTLSIWKDLNATISQLLSPEGKVIVSEATTSLTVRDKPSNVELVARFISNLNHNLAKQVLVKIQVLDVTLSSDYNFGINWDVVQRAFHNSTYSLNANYGTPVSITPLSGGPGLPAFGFNRTATTGTGALFNALQQQGKVSVVSEPRVVCLNNQVSVVRIVSQRGYVASVQNTTVTGSSGGNTPVTSEITPGTVVSGLTLYILPKIIDQKVILQVNADISDVNSIDSISSTTGTTPEKGATNPMIQVPRLTQKQFNQRSVIGSGSTLILSGFRRVSNTTGAMQLLDSQSLGGKGAMQSTTDTVILITPIILPGYA